MPLQTQVLEVTIAPIGTGRSFLLLLAVVRLRPRVILAAHGSVAGAMGGQIVVDARTGRLYSFFLYGVQKGSPTIAPTTYIADISSADGGLTWSAPHIISASKFAKLRHDPVRLSSIPFAAIAPRSGELYVVWEDSRLSHGQYPETLLSRSADGAHWSVPVCVNVPDGQAAFVPAVAVTSGGVVGVTYYREETPSGGSLPAAFWFRSSSNGGKSFGAAQRVAGPFDLRKAPRMGDGYFLGDYDGLVSSGERFVACFAVSNAGQKHDRTAVAVATIKQ